MAALSHHGMLSRWGAQFALDGHAQTGWLVIALMAVSATKLRLGLVPVGIGEVMLLTWLLWVARGTHLDIRSMDSLQGVVAWFWITLGVFVSLGAVWARFHDIVSPGAGRDAVAFLFAALFSVIAAGVIGRGVSTIRVVRWTVAAIAIYLGALAIIHLVHPAIVTDPLEFGNRLTGLTTNPNQLALCLAPFPALVNFLLARTENSRDGVLLLLALVAGILAARAVGSDALALAWLAGGLASGLACFVFRGEDGKAGSDKRALIAVVLVVAWSSGTLLNRFFAPEDASRAGTVRTALLHVFTPAAGSQAQNEYWEQNQVRTRLGLWRSGLEAIVLSPVVGLGPGRHSGAQRALQGDEAHNSFIDLGTMAGVPGALLLLWVFLAMGRPHPSMRETEYAACVILLTLAAYASFHFVIRQPIFWFYILLAGAVRKSEG